MKTGLFLHSLLLGLAVTSVAVAAEPEPATAADKPAEPTPAAPAASAEKKPEVDLDPAKAPEKKKTSSELEGSTRDEYSDNKEKGGSEVADEDFGHGFQFGIRGGIAGGYRMVFRYDKSPFCRAPEAGKADKDQQKFCGHGSPLSLDVALSFAPLDFAEPYVWARFGLGGEAETNTESVLAFGAGARIYTMSDSKFKIYVEPAVGIEVEGGAGNDDWKFEDGATPEYKKDFLFHLAVGGQYDFARAFGIYISAGMTTGVLRYIHTGLEVGGGAQVRFP